VIAGTHRFTGARWWMMKIPIIAEVAALRRRRHHRGDALRAGL
jgi:hypothetical protein